MKIQIFLLGAIGAIMALWLGWGFYVIYSTERPPYQVIRNLSAAIEVRQYEEQTWISTPMQTDDSSFPVLASYIFGRNKEEQQVAMTAPVITDHRMAFILPRGLTAAAAPLPCLPQPQCEAPEGSPEAEAKREEAQGEVREEEGEAAQARQGAG